MTRQRILGVVLAGGRSTRFGSDMAPGMVMRVASGERLAADAVIVAGRDHASCAGVADRPRPAMGPLGGLNAALHHAAERGFDAVLSIPVDAFDVPVDLVDELSPAPAYAKDAPVIGLWPVSARAPLDALLAEDTRHSLRAFAAQIAARETTLSRQPVNINTLADLAAVKDTTHGL